MRPAIHLDAPDARVGMAMFVSDMEAAHSRQHQEALIHERMRMAVAECIARQHVKQTKLRHGTEFRLEVYVLSPEQLIQMVEEKAMDLSRRMNMESRFRHE